MNHEEQLIRAFVVPTKRDRYVEMIATAKGRQKFLRELSHFKSLDSRRCFNLPKGVHTAEQIAAFLSKKGAPQTCRVISENCGLDRRELVLADALQEVIGYQMGTFLSCVPGRLAYFENEDGRWVLEHR